MVIKFSESAIHEAEILGQIHNKTVNQQFIKIIAVFDNALVMDHYEGTLRRLISTKNHIETKIIMQLLRDCATALQTLEKSHIVHCDIKPDNLVYRRDHTGQIMGFVLIDFANSAIN